MKQLFMISFFTIILIGCSNNTPEFPATTATTMKSTNEVLLSFTATPSVKNHQQTTTPDYLKSQYRPIIAASPLPTLNPSKITQQCLSLIMDPKQLPEKGYDGTVIIDSWFQAKWTFSEFNQPYLFKTLKSKITLKDKREITGYQFHSFAMSPDLTKVAVLYKHFYQDNSDASQYDFFVFDKNGNLLTSLDFPENLKNARMVAWLDKGILLEIKYDLGSYNESTNYVLFNPFTKIQSSLQTGFPNHYASDYDYLGTDEIYYDPSLTRAVYFAAEKTTMYRLYYSLWDTSNNREITRLYISSYPPGLTYSQAKDDHPIKNTWQGATWSKNSEFAIVSVWLGKQYGLVRINRDGQTETIVQGGVYEYSIAPDSNQLAYWLNNKDLDDSSTLYVKNLETGEIYNYCLGTITPIGMVWSPNSKNLAISFEYEGSVITAIIDFEQKKAIRIDDVAIPVGWLK